MRSLTLQHAVGCCCLLVRWRGCRARQHRTKDLHRQLDPAPTFYPTPEEFQDPYAYIKRCGCQMLACTWQFPSDKAWWHRVPSVPFVLRFTASARKRSRAGSPRLCHRRGGTHLAVCFAAVRTPSLALPQQTRTTAQRLVAMPVTPVTPVWVHRPGLVLVQAQTLVQAQVHTLVQTLVRTLGAMPRRHRSAGVPTMTPRAGATASSRTAGSSTSPACSCTSRRARPCRTCWETGS